MLLKLFPRFKIDHLLNTTGITRLKCLSDIKLNEHEVERVSLSYLQKIRNAHFKFKNYFSKSHLNQTDFLVLGSLCRWSRVSN
ncbi:hypothetical protein DRB05_19550 [Pseudoalteromonas sp. A757]|nr:hypothetical protein DRB05_19550 [Pseudoalteromonas sp. A757]